MTLQEENKQGRSSLLLNYTIDEEETFQRLGILGERGLLPKKRNEILRRSIHAVEDLATVDDKRFLLLLSKKLHSLSKNFEIDTLYFAKDIAHFVSATRIIKNGFLKSDSFETILGPLKNIVTIYDNNKSFIVSEKKELKKEIEKELKKEIEKIAISLDTVFLEPDSIPEFETLTNRLESLKEKSENDVRKKTI